MQLELVHDNRNIRHVVRAIGMMQGASVLVTSPLLNGKVMVIREGQRVIMGLPAQTQDVLVRRSRRIAVELQAAACVESGSGEYGEPVAVILSDLSTTGAMLEAGSPLGAIGSRVRLAFKVPLQDIGERELAIEGLIRSRHEADNSPGQHYHGVEFVSPDAIQLLTLRAFVYGRLLST
jgi:hypothetical protein